MSRRSGQNSDPLIYVKEELFQLMQVAAPKEWAVYQAARAVEESVQNLPEDGKDSPEWKALKFSSEKAVEEASFALHKAAPSAYFVWERVAEMAKAIEKTSAK